MAPAKSWEIEEELGAQAAGVRHRLLRQMRSSNCAGDLKQPNQRLIAFDAQISNKNIELKIEYSKYPNLLLHIAHINVTKPYLCFGTLHFVFCTGTLGRRCAWPAPGCQL
jgi:hypothetical protein